MEIGQDGLMNKSKIKKKIEILYSDNHIMVINKKNGLLTQDSGTGKVNLEDLARDYVKHETKKIGNVFLHACHRLDKDVSGIVLFARTSKALKRLSNRDSHEKMKKTYHAIVSGDLPINSGKLENYILHDNHKSKISTSKNRRAKKAILKFKVLEKISCGTKLEITLLTGRYHQIRIQLSNFGYPIIGDQKYGSKNSLNGIGLHHYKFSFYHPVNDEFMTIKAPYPKNKIWL